jgi:hypothetical protein
MDWAISILNNLIMQLPYADTYIFSYPIGMMMYKLVLLMIDGEAIVMLTKKESQ